MPISPRMKLFSSACKKMFVFRLMLSAITPSDIDGGDNGSLERIIGSTLVDRMSPPTDSALGTVRFSLELFGLPSSSLLASGMAVDITSVR